VSQARQGLERGPLRGPSQVGDWRLRMSYAWASLAKGHAWPYLYAARPRSCRLLPPFQLPHATPRTWVCLLRSACGAVLRGCEQVVVGAPCEGVTAAWSPWGLVVEGSGSSLGSLCLLPLGWCLAGAPFACRWVCMSTHMCGLRVACEACVVVHDCAWSCVIVRGVCDILCGRVVRGSHPPTTGRLPGWGPRAPWAAGCPG